MDAETERRLVALMLTGDIDAKNEIVQRSMGWIELTAATIRKRKRLQMIPLDDLSQECAMAFWRALPRFDPARGFRLQTFMHRRLQGAVQDYLRTLFPPGQRRVAQDQRKTTTLLPPECAESILSGDEPVGAAIEAIDAVERIAGRLPDKMRQVILFRYANGLTQIETGRRMQLSESRVSQLLRSAYRWAREEIERQ